MFTISIDGSRTRGVNAVYDPPARQSRKSEPLDLEFIPPGTLRVGNREQRVGGVVYRLLKSLFGASAREQPVSVLEVDVWGRPVNRNTLWSACRRARYVLIKLNHPLRVAIDGDRIALV
jgi:hypothetical protein